MKSCSVANALSIVGKKWTFVLIEEIAHDKGEGFNAIARKLKNVSPKVLSKRLGELESAGILQKSTSKENNAKRTSYKLTQKGEELYSIMKLVKRWNSRHSDRINCEQMNCTSCPLY